MREDREGERLGQEAESKPEGERESSNALLEFIPATQGTDQDAEEPEMPAFSHSLLRRGGKMA